MIKMLFKITKALWKRSWEEHRDVITIIIFHEIVMFRAW